MLFVQLLVLLPNLLAYEKWILVLQLQIQNDQVEYVVQDGVVGSLVLILDRLIYQVQLTFHYLHHFGRALSLLEILTVLLTQDGAAEALLLELRLGLHEEACQMVNVLSGGTRDENTELALGLLC